MGKSDLAWKNVSGLKRRSKVKRQQKRRKINATKYKTGERI